MATSLFSDKAIIPDDNMVDIALTHKKAFWDELKAYVLENYQDVNQSWKYYSKKAGWSLVFKTKNRTLFYFIPCDGYFKISLVLGEMAVKAAEQSSIPEYIKEAISVAIPYVEGKSFFVDVKDEKVLNAIFTLLKIKEES